jgi:hypothetical protein
LITISPYDLCFLISTTKRPFVILVIQINNILFLANKEFVDLEKKKKKKKRIYYEAKGDIKPRKLSHF